jgi:hypothetical protein
MSFVPNYLSIVEFRVVIKRLPHVEFFTQQSLIPSISTTPITYPTRFNPAFQQGSKVAFSNLDLTFIVDEDMNNYMEIFRWMIGYAFPNDHEQYKEIKNDRDLTKGLFSDISVLIMNSKKNANIEITYQNCFPINLGDVQLNTTESDVTYPQVTATFQYDTFNIRKIST